MHDKHVKRVKNIHVSFTLLKSNKFSALFFPLQEEKYLVIQSMALARRREIKKEKEQKTTKENVSKSVKFKEEVIGYCLLEVEPQLVP